jgi:hypothetical protein
MRILKLMNVALVLALTGAVYAAGAMQETAKTPDKAKAGESCCRMNREGATQATAHKGSKHEGESCCAGGAGCCAGDACDMKHKGAHAKATAQKTATAEHAAGCCAGDTTCCGGGSCSMKHKDASAAANAHAASSCCADKADCSKGCGQECCKAHQADTAKKAAPRC